MSAVHATAKSAVGPLLGSGDATSAMLTTYLIHPRDGFELARHDLILKPLGGSIQIIENQEVPGIENCETPYYTILWADEFFSLQLVEALPAYFHSGVDVLSLYRIIIGTKNVSITPRIFRKGIPFLEGCALADSPEAHHLKILDGWLYSEEDYIES